MIDANIVIQGTTIGAASDLEDNYLILGVSLGNYSLRVMMLNYTKVTIKDVVLTACKVTKISVFYSQ